MQSVISIIDSAEYFSPPSLQQLCTQFCASKPNSILFKRSGSKVKLKKTVILPPQIWEDVMAEFDQDEYDYLSMKMEIYLKVNLKRINLSNCGNLTDENFRVFLKSYPTALEIHNCPLLTKQSFMTINEFGEKLEFLNFGSSTQMIPTDVESWIAKHREEKPKGIKKLTESLSRFFRGKFSSGNDDDLEVKPGLLRTPNLKKLVIWGHYVHQFQNVREENISAQSSETRANGSGDTSPSGRQTLDFWEYLTRDFIANLEYLDLSGCHEVKNLSFLLKAKDTLTHLYLHDVLLDYDDMSWGILNSLTELKFLDVSQYNELASVFPNPDAILESIVTSLPKLSGLDISGSNLAGFGNDLASSCSIKGLKSREDKWLQFLGLLASHYNAAGRENIPAFQITGAANIHQLIYALKYYMKRNSMIRKVIRMLHEKLQESNPNDFIPCQTILDLLMQVIKTHIDDKHTLIVSFATVFYALKKIYYGSMDSHQDKRLGRSRRDRLFAYMNRAMSIHYQDMSLLRNGILNIHILSLHTSFLDLSHAQVLFPTLLKAAKTAIENIGESTESFCFFLQSIAHLLDSMLSCSSVKQITSVDCVWEISLLINQMFRKNILGRNMAVYWRLLLKWIGMATDAAICKSFISADGIGACFRLLKSCIENEAPERAHIMDMVIPVIVLLINLLTYYEPSESIIITSAHINAVNSIFETVRNLYHPELQLLHHVCCGFFTTVASKKESSSLEDPSRREILEKVFQYMKGKENIHLFSFKFRTFEPLYDLLETKDPEIHVWALWTIFTLIESDADTVIPMIRLDKRINLATLHERFVRDDIPQDRKEDISRLCDRIVESVNHRDNEPLSEES